MTWVIKQSYTFFHAVELVRRTEKMVFYIDRAWGRSKESRGDASGFLPWEGTQEDALAIIEKLKSAAAEKTRRQVAASEWFTKEKERILERAVTPHGDTQ